MQELAHYLMLTAKCWGPGGKDLHEQATDALAVQICFGLFLANTAFETTAWSDTVSSGHGWQRRGYLTQNELVYALALFLAATKQDQADAMKHLKPQLHSAFKKAVKEIAAIEDIHRVAQDARLNARAESQNNKH